MAKTKPTLNVNYNNFKITTNTGARFRIAERRKQVSKLMRDNPGIQQAEIAEMLGVDRATISRDIKAITQEYQIQTTEAFMVHFDRSLREIREKMEVCDDRLQRLHSNAHQGARWMEEWTKLKQVEIKLLGLNAPERFVVEKRDGYSKEERDNAVKAALGITEKNIIDITPKTPEQIPYLEETEDAI